MINIPDKELIGKFIEASYKLKSTIAEQNLTSANKCYQDLYAIYREINDSQLEQVHKEIAYQQLVTSYHLVQDLKQSTTAPTNIIAIAIVIIIVSTIVFVNPRMIGLAVFQEKITQTVNLEFAQNNAKEIQLKSVPTSLTASGEISGDGDAKIFAETEGRRLLVWDSTKTKTRKFSNECADTCVLPKLSATKITLSAETNNAVLKVNTIQYYIRGKNHAPVWTEEPKTILVKGETTIDFGKQFSDPDGDELVYLATMPEGVQASVSGSILIIHPNGVKGQKQMELLVSDMKETTRAKIMLDLQ